MDINFYVKKILNLIATPLIITDLDNKIIYINDDFINLFKIPRNELYGNKINYLIQKADEFPNNVKKNAIIRNNRNEPFNVTVIRQKNIYTFIDVTEYRKIQEELVSKIDLEQCAGNDKNEYLIKMSHELKSPLNGIIGYTNILKKKLGDNHEYIHELEIIEQSGTDLHTMLDNIIDMARVEAGQIKIKKNRFFVQHFIDRIVNKAQKKANEKGLEFITEFGDNLPDKIITDESKLEQIILNLLYNAIKFTDTGQITFLITFRSGLFTFSISDTGIGIEPENIEKIFVPFSHVGKKTSKRTGTGLGLTISNKLCKMISSGPIHVKSVPDNGSTFWFNIKTRYFYTQEVIDKKVVDYRHVTGYHGKKKNILLIDDSKTSRSVFEVILKDLGFTIYSADNGWHGIAEGQKHTMDLILCDYQMPDLAGIEVVTGLRAKNVHCPIIVMSASLSDENIEKCFEAGASDFIFKPININILLDTITKYLKLKWISEDKKDGDGEEPGDFPIPTTDLLKNIKVFAHTGNMQMLVKELDEIEQKYTEYKQFSDFLKKLAKEFNVRRIKDYINSI